MKNIMSKFSSDNAAANTTEMIIIIALAVFAVLALFTFILQPVRNGAKELGSTTNNILKNLTDPKNVGKDVDAITK